MNGLEKTISVSLMVLSFCACKTGKPSATAYKEKFSAGATADATPAARDGKPAPAPGTSGTEATGNAQSGLAVLTANCETAGCHKDNGVTLTKTSKMDDATAAKAAHRGVQPVFSPTNVADIKAALATR